MDENGVSAGAEADSDEQQRELLREAVTMALYVSLSLLAVLVALPPGAQLSEANPAFTVLVTAVALLFAHAVAFRLSSRLVNKGLLDDVGRKLLAAQLAGGLATAIVASVPVFLLGPDGIRVSEFLLLAFVAATGYRAARSVPTSRTRALAYVGLLVLVVLAVLFIKTLVGH
jgi:hypothetical protein